MTTLPDKTALHQRQDNPDDIERTLPGKRDRKPDGRFEPGDLVLGRYKVLAELGQGGMGVVYKCFDETAGIEIALKALPPELSYDSAEMEEVKENFQLVSKLVHQNIAISKQLERDNSNGSYYLIMEYAEGENLRRWIKRRRKENTLTSEAVLAVVRQVADTLDYAHGQKIIHRDIKPGNIMVDAEGHVKVLDFGLAAQLHSSMTRVSMAYHGTSGTGPYMAPEQWRGQPQGAAADQYALAVMTYEMLAGHLPFDSSEPAVLQQAVLTQEILPVKGIPLSMQNALRRALSKDAGKRFESCSAFVNALEGKKTRSGIGFFNERTGMVIAAAAILLAILILAALGGWNYHARQRIRKEERRAKIEQLLNNAKENYNYTNWDEAIRQAREVLKLDPANPDAKELISRVTVRKRDQEERRAKIEQILNNAKENYNYTNWDEAIRQAREVLKLDPANPDAKDIVEQAIKKLQEENKPRPVTPDPIPNSAPKPDPGLNQIRLIMDKAENALKDRSWYEASRHAEAVLKLDPNNARAQEIRRLAQSKIEEVSKKQQRIELDKEQGVKFSNDGKTLTKIPRHFSKYVIPDGITAIGDKAFSGCSDLTSVFIPDSVERIGKEAFYKCARLENIAVPDSVKTVGKEAFAGCSSLVSVKLPGSLTGIEEKTFYKCSRLENITIPDKAAIIREKAFSQCGSLKEVIIGSGVSRIEQEAFIDCSGLKNLTIPGNVNIIGKEAFYRCYSLTKVTICSGVKIIGPEAFKHCKALVNATIPPSVTKIEKEAFYDTGCEEEIKKTCPGLYGPVR